MCELQELVSSPNIQTSLVDAHHFGFVLANIQNLRNTFAQLQPPNLSISRKIGVLTPKIHALNAFFGDGFEVAAI